MARVLATDGLNRGRRLSRRRFTRQLRHRPGAKTGGLSRMSTPLFMDPKIQQAELPISKRFWACALILVAVSWALQGYAIWSSQYLPLVDLPNHMARHYLEAVKLSGGDIGPYYDLELRLLPNLGADLILPFLI